MSLQMFQVPASLALMVCCCLSVSSVRGADEQPPWPQEGGTLAASGQSRFVGPRSGRVQWQVLLDGWSTSPVVAGDGTVYVGTANGTLFAIHADGSVKWKRQWPVAGLEHPEGVSDAEKAERKALGIAYAGEIASCALAPDGAVYVAQNFRKQTNAPRHLIALAPDGGEKWRYALGSADIETNLTIDEEGTVFFGTAGKSPTWFAIGADGKQRWHVLPGEDEEVTGSASIGPNGLLYVAGDRLRALNRRDGSIRHEAEERVMTPRGRYGPAIGPDGTVYAASGARRGSTQRLYAFRPDLTLKWSLRAGVMELTPAVAADGTVYIHTWSPQKGELQPGVHAINPDGSAKWSLANVMKAETGGPAGSDSSPILGADGVVYFGSDVGRIFAVTPQGKLLWDLNLGGEFDMRPALDQRGRLYVGNAGGIGARGDGRPRCHAIGDEPLPETEKNN